MHFKIPIIEPLLITASNGEWVHPNIELLTLDFEEETDGNLYGNIIKLDIEFDTGEIFRTIVKTNESGMDEFMSPDGIQEYLEMLFVSLGENVWKPDTIIPFVDTKFGKLFNKQYPIFESKYRAIISPDISLKSENDEWWWNS